MYPYIHIILPSYTVMALLGGFTALCLMYLRIEKNTIEFTTFLSLFFFSVLGAIVGSKIVFAVTQIPWLIENFSLTNLIMLIPQSGFVFYGGLFGTIFTLLFMTRRDAILRKKYLMWQCRRCLYFILLVEWDVFLPDVVMEKSYRIVLFSAQ